MPEGFETIIGEKGVSLSGGQKQRLAMSRAMILDPDILILDDSLSAVDAKTEHAIIDNLKHTRKDKTTIITAHRLSAVVHADLILVMQNGRIIERGRHEDLLAQGGWYAKTYESQKEEKKMMPNQNQWSVFKRLLTYLKPYKFLTFLALAFLLSTTVIKSIIPLVASYFIDHYLHDMNQAASLILIGYYGLYLLQTLVQYLGNLFFARVSCPTLTKLQQALSFLA